MKKYLFILTLALLPFLAEAVEQVPFRLDAVSKSQTILHNNRIFHSIEDYVTPLGAQHGVSIYDGKAEVLGTNFPDFYRSQYYSSGGLEFKIDLRKGHYHIIFYFAEYPGSTTKGRYIDIVGKDNSSEFTIVNDYKLKEAGKDNWKANNIQHSFYVGRDTAMSFILKPNTGIGDNYVTLTGVEVLPFSDAIPFEWRDKQKEIVFDTVRMEDCSPESEHMMALIKENITTVFSEVKPGPYGYHIKKDGSIHIQFSFKIGMIRKPEEQ